MTKPLTSAQIRAARALLRWSAEDLARRSLLSVATIRRAELTEDETSMTAANDLAVRRALEAAGGRIHRREWRRSGGVITKASAVESDQNMNPRAEAGSGDRLWASISMFNSFRSGCQFGDGWLCVPLGPRKLLARKIGNRQPQKRHTTAIAS